MNTLNQTAPVTDEQLTRRIAAAIHVIRPDWPTASLLTFITRDLADYPRHDLAVALFACATARDDDGAYLAQTPRYILDGDWLTLAPNAREDWATKERLRQERDERIAQIRVRNQAIAACHWCDTAGRLASGQLCHHDDPDARAARAAAGKAQAAAQIRPAPRRTDQRADQQEDQPT